MTGAKVTVKEYMPDTLCSRKKGDPQIVVDANRLPLYKTYMSEFVELNKALLKARSMTHTSQLFDLFIRTTGSGVSHHEDVVVFIKSG